MNFYLLFSEIDLAFSPQPFSIHFDLYEIVKLFLVIPFSAEVSLRCPSEELPATGSELATELLLSVQERFRPLLESELAGSPM